MRKTLRRVRSPCSSDLRLYCHAEVWIPHFALQLQGGAGAGATQRKGCHAARAVGPRRRQRRPQQARAPGGVPGAPLSPAVAPAQVSLRVQNCMCVRLDWSLSV